MVQVFGEAGRHARSAVGVAELPAGSAVEIEAVVALRPLDAPSGQPASPQPDPP